MAIRLFPKVIKFFDLFKKQNAVLVESVSFLDEIFQNYSSVNELCKKIIEKELEGNQVSREISISLAETFITPIDREDVHSMNMSQEQVLNSVKSISTRMGLHRFSSIKPGAKELVHNLKQMLDEIAAMVASLEKKTNIDKNIVSVKKLKAEADALLLVSMGEIYEDHAENETNILELIQWSHIYDRIEDAFAEAEMLANEVEGIMLKYS